MGRDGSPQGRWTQLNSRSIFPRLGVTVRVNPEHYREQAAKSRDLAKGLSGDVREHLLDVAEQYDRLADEAEAKLK